MNTKKIKQLDILMFKCLHLKLSCSVVSIIPLLQQMLHAHLYIYTHMRFWPSLDSQLLLYWGLGTGSREGFKSKTPVENRIQKCSGHLDLCILFEMVLISLFQSFFLKQGEWALEIRLAPSLWCNMMPEKVTNLFIRLPCFQIHQGQDLCFCLY